MIGYLRRRVSSHTHGIIAGIAYFGWELIREISIMKM